MDPIFNEETQNLTKDQLTGQNQPQENLNPVNDGQNMFLDPQKNFELENNYIDNEEMDFDIKKPQNQIQKEEIKQNEPINQNQVPEQIPQSQKLNDQILIQTLDFQQKLTLAAQRPQSCQQAQKAIQSQFIQINIVSNLIIQQQNPRTNQQGQIENIEYCEEKIVKQFITQENKQSTIPDYLLQNFIIEEPSQPSLPFSLSFQNIQTFNQGIQSHPIQQNIQKQKQNESKFKLISEQVFDKVQNDIKEELSSNSNFYYKEENQWTGKQQQKHQGFKKQSIQKKQSFQEPQSESEQILRLKKFIKKGEQIQNNNLLKQFKNEHYQVRDKYFEEESQIYKKYILNMQKTLQIQYEKCRTHQNDTLNDLKGWTFDKNRIPQICELNQKQFYIYLKKELPMNKPKSLGQRSSNSEQKFQQLQQFQFKPSDETKQWKSLNSAEKTLSNQMAFSPMHQFNKKVLLEQESLKNQKLQNNSAKFRTYLRNIMVHMSNFVDMTDKVELVFKMNYKQLMAFYASVVGPKNIIRYQSFNYIKPQTPYDDDPYGLNGVYDREDDQKAEGQISQSQLSSYLKNSRDFHQQQKVSQDYQSPNLDQQEQRSSQQRLTMEKQNQCQNQQNQCQNQQNQHQIYQHQRQTQQHQGQIQQNQVSIQERDMQKNAQKNQQIQRIEEEQIEKIVEQIPQQIEKQHKKVLQQQQNRSREMSSQVIHNQEQSLPVQSNQYSNAILNEILQEVNEIINEQHQTPIFGQLEDLTLENTENTPLHLSLSNPLNNSNNLTDASSLNGNSQALQNDAPSNSNNNNQTIISEQSISIQQLLSQQNLQTFTSEDLISIIKSYLPQQSIEIQQAFNKLTIQELKQFVRQNIANPNSKNNAQNQEIQQTSQNVSNNAQNQEIQQASQNISNAQNNNASAAQSQKELYPDLSIDKKDLILEERNNQISQNHAINHSAQIIKDQSSNQSESKDKDKISSVMGNFQPKQKHVIDILSDDSQQSIQVPKIFSTQNPNQSAQPEKNNQQIVQQDKAKNGQESNGQKQKQRSISAQEIRKVLFQTYPGLEGMIYSASDYQIYALYDDLTNKQESKLSQNHQHQINQEQNENSNQQGDRAQKNAPSSSVPQETQMQMQMEHNQNNQNNNQAEQNQVCDYKEDLTYEQLDAIVKNLSQSNDEIKDSINQLSRAELLELYKEGIRQKKRNQSLKNKKKGKNNAEIINLEDDEQKKNNQFQTDTQKNKETEPAQSSKSSFSYLDYYNQLLQKQLQKQRAIIIKNSKTPSTTRVRINATLLLNFIEAHDHKKNIQSIRNLRGKSLQQQKAIEKQISLVYFKQLLKLNKNSAIWRSGKFQQVLTNKSKQNKQKSKGFIILADRKKYDQITDEDMKKRINLDCQLAIQLPKISQERKKRILQLRKIRENQINQQKLALNANSQKFNPMAENSLKDTSKPLQCFSNKPLIRKRYWMMVQQEQIDPRQDKLIEQQIALNNQRKRVNRTIQIQKDYSKIAEIFNNLATDISADMQLQ